MRTSKYCIASKVGNWMSHTFQRKTRLWLSNRANTYLQHMLLMAKSWLNIKAVAPIMSTLYIYGKNKCYCSHLKVSFCGEKSYSYTSYSRYELFITKNTITLSYDMFTTSWLPHFRKIQSKLFTQLIIVLVEWFYDSFFCKKGIAHLWHYYDGIKYALQWRNTINWWNCNTIL